MCEWFDRFQSNVCIFRTNWWIRLQCTQFDVNFNELKLNVMVMPLCRTQAHSCLCSTHTHTHSRTWMKLIKYLSIRCSGKWCSTINISVYQRELCYDHDVNLSCMVTESVVMLLLNVKVRQTMDTTMYASDSTQKVVEYIKFVHNSRHAHTHLSPQ